jgi:predicted nuclease with TOPRIM domain
MPTNILKSVEEAAAKEIIKYRHKMMQQVNSGLDKLKDIEFPDMKKKFEQAEEEFNKSMEDRLNQELSNGAQHFTEVKNDISSLGTDLGLLKESVAKFFGVDVEYIESLMYSHTGNSYTMQLFFITIYILIINC